MNMTLIPRVRMNYTFMDFVRSLFVDDGKDTFRIKAEKWLSDYYNGRPVMLTSAGRSALYYILRSLPQTKVYIPAYTCPVVGDAVMQSGKEIHYAESMQGEFNADCYPNLDSDSIVVATHQFGYPCAIKSIAEACQKVHAILIEDCAPAIGTKVDGQLVGTFGDYAFVSFNHSKQLTIPRGGGCLVTKTPEQMSTIKELIDLKYDRPRSLKNRRFALISLLINNSILYRLFHSKMIAPHENGERNTIADLSSVMDTLYNQQMDNWQAYLLYVQLKRMDIYSERRSKLFDYYSKEINNVFIQKPYQAQGADYSRYAIKVRNRDKYQIYQYCVENGVDLDFSHSHLTCPTSFVEEHQLADCILDLPFYYKLSYAEAKKVVSVINSIK